jgi:hypothetical protein
MSESEYHATDRAFMDLYFAVLRGEIRWDDPSVAELQQRLGLVRDPHPDRRRYDLPENHVEEIMFWEMVENFVPDTAPMAIDRILGPWGDLPASIELQRAAVTALSFTYNLEDRGRAFKRYLRDDDKPSIATRQAIKMVEHTPAMLWKTDGYRWQPLLPIFEYWIPEGEVSGAITPISPTNSVKYVVSRVTPTKAGWRAYGAIGFETAPDITALMNRLRFALTRLRRHERRATWEDLLRDRCELVYRHLANHAWLNQTTTIKAEQDQK